MASYATVEDLTDRVSATYVVPDNAAQLLEKASELIDFVTFGRSAREWEISEASAFSIAMTKATCDQVEYWLEVGEEHDVVGLVGALMAGRVQTQRLPGVIGPRARRTLTMAGAWNGVGAF